MNNSRLVSISIFTFLFFSLAFQKGAAQSAWTKNKGELYSQFTYSTIPDYNEIFSSSTYITSRNITDNTFQLYGEYGLNDDITVIASIPLKSISTSNETDNSTFPLTIEETSKVALGNIVLGLRYKLLDSKFILSSQLNIEINSSDFDINSGIRTGYDAWTFTPTINLGRSFSKYYFQVFSGVDIRTNSYSSNFRAGGEIGLTSIKKTTIIAFLDIVSSFNNGDFIDEVSSLETALYINNQDYAGYGLKAIYEIASSFGINAGFGGAFSANNVAKQAALNVGFFYKI